MTAGARCSRNSFSLPVSIALGSIQRICLLHQYVGAGSPPARKKAGGQNPIIQMDVQTSDGG